MLHNLFHFPQNAIYFLIVSFSMQLICLSTTMHYNLNTHHGWIRLRYKWSVRYFPVACSTQCRWHTRPASSAQDSHLCCLCVVLHNKKHETSYHLIIHDCPFDHFIMLYQLLKMCSTTGLNHEVSVYRIVQSRCLFQWMAVNGSKPHRLCRALLLEPELIYSARE